MKPRILLIIVAFFMIFFSCGKKNNNPSGPTISKYIGEWTGTTTQNLSVYFNVNDAGIIDSLTVRFRMSFPTFTCTATFAADTTIEIIDDAFEVFLHTPITNVATTVRGIFSSENSITGDYDEFSGGFFITCGSTLALGSGGAFLAEGTWDAAKTINTNTNKSSLSRDEIYEER